MASVYDLSETVMEVHGCSRRQAIEFLHSDLEPSQFFSDIQLTGYVPFPEEEINSGFQGYYYIDNNGNKAHSWDFEESIGE